MNESFEEGFDSAISQMKGAVGEVWGNNYIHNIIIIRNTTIF